MPQFYGDPYADLVIGTGNDRAYGHYVTGAFDEFVIWERALSPKDILLYYNAATGRKTAKSNTGNALLTSNLHSVNLTHRPYGQQKDMTTL